MTGGTFFKITPSPLGNLRMVANQHSLLAVLWPTEKAGRVRLPSPLENSRHPVLLEAERQLGEYFEGKRKKFELRLEFHGTEFQKQVWRELLKIPFGATRSYGDIAKALGHPKAVRAVGAANARNPLSIVAPCHRVIGKNGKLTGFAGGLDSKKFLLELEGVSAGIEG